MAEQEAFIQQLAQAIHRHQLSFVALFLLELGQPVTFLGGQLLWVAQPVFGLFGAQRTVDQLAAVLEQPAAVAQLSTQLAHLEKQNV